MSEVPLYLLDSSNCFTVMRSSSEEGSYVRLVDFVSLNSRPRVKKKKEEAQSRSTRAPTGAFRLELPGSTSLLALYLLGSVREREREREIERMCERGSVCVKERECVCVCERARERGLGRRPWWPCTWSRD